VTNGLREETFRDVCEAEGLSIRRGDNLEKERGWVYEPDRQIALLSHFWKKVKDGERQSLIFYYVKGNPVDENSPRLIVGVGRIKEVGPQLYFDGSDTPGIQYPIWTRTVTQDYPNQGFRLPYQEYLRQNEDPLSFACYVPKESILQFSFVGEHLTDDQAVGILERLIHSVEVVRQENKVPGPWAHHLEWLNDRLAEVWTGRGPYPGIGSVLQYLDFAQGTSFQRIDLKDFVKEGKDPWAYVRGILDGREQIPARYEEGLGKAQLRWRALGRKPIRQELIDILVRFELTVEQVKRICDPDERSNAGINATDEEIIANPYILCERDLGTSTSEPVTLDTIDRGMRPEGNAALFIPKEKLVSQDDTRRVRAVAVTVLRESAEAGDTVLPIGELLNKIRERFPERRACRPDREIFEAEAEFHQELLWVSLNSDPKLAALKNLQECEALITQTIKRRIKRTNPAPNPSIDWYAALVKEFNEPATDREKAALVEKAKALETLYTQRISVLTGSAGTGKTSALRVFLDCLEAIEGKLSVRLLAPTGKARVRLSSTTKRNAFTIHQLLLKLDWFLPEIFVLKPQGGGEAAPSTVIIDECSMVPTDLLGVLFKAIKLDMVRRLILVGDPNQLPPIGPGRPFVDIIAWLQEENLQCIATLKTTMRTADDAEVPTGQSVALTFADGYRNDIINPADDEILSDIARGKSKADLEVHFWNDQDELKSILRKCLQDLGVGDDGDYKSFNASLGITDKPDKQADWKAAERWQILSPLRGHGFGTEELNRMIQFGYRRGLIKKAQGPWSKVRPFGEQQLVWTDKVIQIVNRRHWGWPKDKGLDYVANGEIGIITNTYRNDHGPYLQVGFSTQDGVTYRYYRGQVEDELELAYALTVHKAQGSDFERVFLVIPKEAQTLSRELIYTGLTRFRKKLVLLIEGDTHVLEELRLPENSDTHLRNTNMFTLSLRSEDKSVPYPEALIHRTATGVPVRSKSEVIVADTLTRLGLSWEYEKKISAPDDAFDFRLPDFTIGFEGDILYWEHLGMLTVPAYREGWERKRRWYEERLNIPVIGDGAEGKEIVPGTFPIVITSRDGENGSINVPRIEQLIRKYILLED
jgi:exodeoxyribonuclease V alpha subunit